jgi:hypothetical protein
MPERTKVGIGVGVAVGVGVLVGALVGVAVAVGNGVALRVGVGAGTQADKARLISKNTINVRFIFYILLSATKPPNG